MSHIVFVVVAQRLHNQEVVGLNPTDSTYFISYLSFSIGVFFIRPPKEVHLQPWAVKATKSVPSCDAFL